MLGDSRGNSCDSRTWGAVPRSDLVGPVVLTYWPPLRIGS
jgi:signal peptidase I